MDFETHLGFHWRFFVYVRLFTLIIGALGFVTMTISNFGDETNNFGPEASVYAGEPIRLVIPIFLVIVLVVAVISTVSAITTKPETERSFSGGRS